MVKRSYKISIVQGLFCFIIFFIVTANISKLNQICVIDDEFGYWGVGAYFAGYDWTGLTPTSPYYGFGIGLIYSFLFRIFSDSVMMYKAAIILNAIFLIGAFLISFSCYKKMYPDEGITYGLLFCALITFYPNTIVQSQVGWTESLLYFWFWLCYWIIIKIWENANCLNCGILGCLLMYGYMIHQRTLGVVISGIIVLIIGVLINRISKKHLLSFALFFLISLGIFIFVKNYLNNNFWLTMDQAWISDVNNLSGQISKLQYVFSIDGIKSLLLGLFSKAVYLVISSFGLALWGVKVLIVKSAEVGRGIVNSKIKHKGEIKTDFSVFDFSMIFLLLAFISTFAISAIFMINMNYRLDTLLYGRYNEFVVGPLLLLGCMEMKRNFKKKDIKKEICFIIALFLIAYVMNYIISSYNFTTFYPINASGISRFFENMDQSEWEIFEIIIQLAMFFLIICIGKFAIDRKNKSVFWLFASLCIIVFWWKPSIEYNCDAIYRSQDVYCEYTEDVANCIKNYMKEEHSNNDIIYIVDDENEKTFTTDMFDRYIKYIQFYLYDRKIECVTASQYENMDDKIDNIYIIRRNSNATIKFYANEEYLYGNNMYCLFVS